MRTLTSVIAFTLALFLTGVTSLAQDIGLPEPTGPFAVGTTHLLFVDKTRPETFTEDPDDRREVTVRAWYPADPSPDSHRAPYYDNGGDIVKNFGYPPGLADLDTHSGLDIPVRGRKEPYPVIIFNHGWGEHAVQNTVLMEHLASHGYVVLSAAHHYEAKFWVYPDGSMKYLNFGSPGFQQIMAEQGQPVAMELFHAMFKARGAASQDSIFRRMVEAMPVLLGESPRLWADDISFLIDELDSLNRSEGIFRGRLDLGKIGVMGMSMGGIAAGQACIDDGRITAAMNIDGGLAGDLLDAMITPPLMYMNSKRFIGYEEIFAGHAAGDAYIVTIGEADHYDFSDFTLLHRSHPMIGTVPGERMLGIVEDYTLAFFDLYLKGKDSDLLSGKKKPYPEVDFLVERRP
jgi:predicted dienelactone hydrolase